MSSSRKVILNTGYQVAGKVVTAIGALLTTMLLTRGYGEVGYGQYSIAITYASTFFIIAQFGINIVATKLFSEDRRLMRRRFTSLLVLRLLLGIFLVGLGSWLLRFLPYSPLVTRSAQIALLLVINHAIFSTCQIIFQTKLRYQQSALALSVGTVLGLGLVLWGVSRGLAIDRVVWLVVLSNLAIPLTALWLVRSHIRLRGLIDFGFWRQILVAAAPVGLALILNVMLSQTDRLVLSILSSEASVGIYSLGHKVFETALVLPTFFMNALYPILVKSYRVSRERAAETLQFGLDCLLLLAVPVLIGGTLLAEEVVIFIGGADFAAAAIPFRILMLVSIFFFLSAPFGWLLVVRGRQRWLPLIYGGAFLVDSVLNVFLIPRYDYVACAWVTGFSEFLVLLAVAAVGLSGWGALPKLGLAGRYLIGGLLMGGVLLVLGPAHLGVKVLLGGATYLGVLWLLGVFARLQLKEVAWPLPRPTS